MEGEAQIETNDAKVVTAQRQAAQKQAEIDSTILKDAQTQYEKELQSDQAAATANPLPAVRVCHTPSTSSMPAAIAWAIATIAMWWLKGLSERTTVAPSWRQSATIARALARSVLSECMTPFGVPVVPEVNAR